MRCVAECVHFDNDCVVMTAGTHHPTRDGTSIRDFIHVTDLVDAHVRGVSHLANPPEIYNIGTGRGVSVREFVDACRAVTGEHITVREQAEARPGDYAEVGFHCYKSHKNGAYRSSCCRKKGRHRC